MLVDLRVFDYDVNGRPSPDTIAVKELIREVVPLVPRVGDHICYQYWSLKVESVEWFFSACRKPLVTIRASWTDQKAFNAHYKVDR